VQLKRYKRKVVSVLQKMQLCWGFFELYSAVHTSSCSHKSLFSEEFVSIGAGCGSARSS